MAAIRQQSKAGAKPAISCISLYEISRIVERRRIVLEVPLETFLDRVHSLFDIKPLSNGIAMIAARFHGDFPGDPADRMIAATAVADGLSLITADREIRRSGVVKTIW